MSAGFSRESMRKGDPGIFPLSPFLGSCSFWIWGTRNAAWVSSKGRAGSSSHFLTLLSPQFHSTIYPSIQQTFVELTVVLLYEFFPFSLIKVHKNTVLVCHCTNANPLLQIWFSQFHLLWFLLDSCKRHTYFKKKKNLLHKTSLLKLSTVFTTKKDSLMDGHYWHIAIQHLGRNLIYKIKDISHKE